MKLDRMLTEEMIRRTLLEDMPLGDITTDNIVDADTVSTARLIAKEGGVVAGLDIVQWTFSMLDAGVVFTRDKEDGSRVENGDRIATVKGRTAALLKGERTALNYLQRLSGIATETRKMCALVEGLPVRVTDTRKTTPGMRYLEKYAVRVGGGSNHRYSLSDGVLIKDNHISAAGSITVAVERIRRSIPHTVKIEVETESREQVQEALAAGADIIMLDNMGIEAMAEAVKLIGGRALVEASGNIRDDRIVAIAKTGVDIISMGALTYAAKALDISMKFI